MVVTVGREVEVKFWTFAGGGGGSKLHNCKQGWRGGWFILWKRNNLMPPENLNETPS